MITGYWRGDFEKKLNNVKNKKNTDNADGMDLENNKESIIISEKVTKTSQFFSEKVTEIFGKSDKNSLDFSEKVTNVFISPKLLVI
ncbi:MAG: hypothetical protein MJZ66_00280 [Bacteroidales bacterium]|nr:hypothetical protein [Bacteroidales bacterium]